MARTRGLLAFLTVAAVLSGCGDDDSGDAIDPPSESSSSAPSSSAASPEESPAPEESPGYDFPTDGSGPATQPFDQPAPIPSPFWSGWIDQRSGPCEWIPNALARQIGWDGSQPDTGAGCSFRLKNGDDFQVTWFGAYHWLDPGFDSWHFIRPVRIAGLEGREYSLEAAEPDDCEVALNSRGLTSPLVEVYDGNRELNHTREQRCATARNAAKLIAEHFIPLAGGKVWPKTPQRPTVATAQGQNACDIVSDTVRGNAGVYGAPQKPGTTPEGDTCVARQDGTTISVLVTKGPNQGLAQTKPLDGADVTDLPAGPLQSRRELVGDVCTQSTEFLPGRTLRITFESPDEPANLACIRVQDMTHDALLGLIDNA